MECSGITKFPVNGVENWLLKRFFRDFGIFQGVENFEPEPTAVEVSGFPHGVGAFGDMGLCVCAMLIQH
jgi:hypothetical protein